METLVKVSGIQDNPMEFLEYLISFRSRLWTNFSQLPYSVLEHMSNVLETPISRVLTSTMSHNVGVGLYT